MNRDNYYHVHKGKPPIIFIVAGILLMLFSTINILQGDYYTTISGSILCFAGIFLVSLRSGTKIETVSGTLIKYWGFLGIKFRTTEKLPPVKYISLMNVKTSQRVWVESITTEIRDIKCRVNLVLNHPQKKFIKIITAQAEESIRIAKELSAVYCISILDLTGKEKKWINPK